MLELIIKKLYLLIRKTAIYICLGIYVHWNKMIRTDPQMMTLFGGPNGIKANALFLLLFLFSFFLRSPQGDCIYFLMIKVIFECTIWAKDLQPKGNRNVPMSFPFAFISGRALRNEKASSIHCCSQVRAQKDDSEVASDTRQNLSPGRAWERQQLASSAENLHSPNKGGTQGSGMGRAGSTVRPWNTQGQTCLVNYSDCKEGALSRQADRMNTL